MNKNNTPLETRRALNEFKMEMAEEMHVNHDHLYNLEHNLTPSKDVTKQNVKTREKSRKNPNYSFSEFLGKGF